MNFVSTFGFYLATFFVHKGLEITENGSEISVNVYVFSRQLLGVTLFAPLFIIGHLKRSHLKSDFNSKSSLLSVLPSKWVVIRAFTNFSALFAFYQAVGLVGAAQGNILNMTYPFFVLLFAYPMLRERLSLSKIIIAIICFFGIFLYFLSSGVHVGQLSSGSLWGLASGIIAAISIISLRSATSEANDIQILFWLFAIGSIISLPLCYSELSLISLANLKYLLLSAICGLCAQWFLTLSYRKLDAITGSLTSTTRIPIAIAVGIFFLEDKFLWHEYLGALLIFISNVLIGLHSIGKKTFLKKFPNYTL